MIWPSVLPLFPLSDAVLFPGVPLPLHVFEPWEREMLRDVAAGHGVLGMALLRSGARVPATAEFHRTGCAGRVVSVEALPDGNFNVLVHGVREFAVESEIDAVPYRKAVVRWRSLLPADAALPEDLRREVTVLIRDCLGWRLDEAADRLLEDPALGDGLLVNFFCYFLDLPLVDKQALLEEPTLASRARRLVDVLEFDRHGRRTGFRCASVARSQ